MHLYKDIFRNLYVFLSFTYIREISVAFLYIFIRLTHDLHISTESEYLEHGGPETFVIASPSEIWISLGL